MDVDGQGPGGTKPPASDEDHIPDISSFAEDAAALDSASVPSDPVGTEFEREGTYLPSTPLFLWNSYPLFSLLSVCAVASVMRKVISLSGSHVSCTHQVSCFLCVYTVSHKLPLPSFLVGFQATLLTGAYLTATEPEEDDSIIRTRTYDLTITCVIIAPTCDAPFHIVS